jgi:hypothetical protein
VWDELEREKDSSALALLEKQRREAENKRLSPPLACRPGTSEEDTRAVHPPSRPGEEGAGGPRPGEEGTGGRGGGEGGGRSRRRSRRRLRSRWQLWP